MQLDIINAFCSVSRQAQFDVLAEMTSTSHDNRNVRDGDTIPCAPSLRKYWGYFQSMQGHASTLHFTDHREQPHHLTCSRGGQGDGFETVHFAVTIHPSIGRVFQRHPACKGAAICDDYFVVGPLQAALASKPPSALPSLVLPPLSMLFLSGRGEGQNHSSSEAQQHAGDRPPADQSQRIITAHLMQCWKNHQYLLGHVALTRSEEYLKLQSVQRIPAVPKDERDTIFHEYFPQTDTVDPNAPPENPAAPPEKKKVWNLNWGPLLWISEMSAQRLLTLFGFEHIEQQKKERTMMLFYYFVRN